MQTKWRYLLIFTILILQQVSYAAEFLSLLPEEAFQKAKLENKQILVFYTADWCHWCTRMEKDVYSDTEVSAVIKNSFIAIKIEEGSKEAEIWLRYVSPTSIPYTALLSAGGELRRAHKGYETKSDFVSSLNSVINYENSELAALQKQFIAGEISHSQVLRLLNIRKDYGLEYQASGQAYLSKSILNYMDKTVQQLFLLLGLSHKDQLIRDLLSDLNKQDDLVSSESLNALIFQITLSAYTESFLKKDLGLLTRFLEENAVLIQRTFFPGTRDELIHYLHENHRFEMKTVPISL